MAEDVVHRAELVDDTSLRAAEQRMRRLDAIVRSVIEPRSRSSAQRSAALSYGSSGVCT